MVLGITGGYCAGKDLAVGILVRYGIEEINEDRLGHQALEILKDRIKDVFGAGVLDESGKVDRRALGSVVFANLKALERLERIVHPWMVEETKRRIAEAENQNIVINAAILHRMGLHRVCDLIIIIRAPFLVRFRRAKRRDGHSWTETFKRLRTQARQRRREDIPKQFLNEKGEDVDTVRVNNGGSKDTLEKRLAGILSDHGITGR